MKTILKCVILLFCLVAFKVNTLKAQSTVNIKSDELLVAFDSNNVKITECDLPYNEIKKGRFARIQLKSGFTPRGRIVGFHKKGVFLVSKDFLSKQMLLGFYPFSEMTNFSFGRSYGNFVLLLTGTITVVSTIIIAADDPSDASIGLVIGGITASYLQPFYGIPYWISKSIQNTYWNSKKIKQKQKNLYQFMASHPKVIHGATNVTLISNP